MRGLPRRRRKSASQRDDEEGHGDESSSEAIPAVGSGGRTYIKTG